ncbi:Glutathione S-transferase [Mariprofundus aestuarium]|uniref:Glutathione S-transferase n=2 Tax=Mariprofundus aestuarium TaxID=1921086 RepID=A0A2K8L9A0_MARES|nr:Glutathione S-transferase [Mariprofundus aestuarium]
MALVQAGIQCVIREVLLKEKPQHLLAISPKGTVPVLLLADGSVMDESLDIMHWAMRQHNAGWSETDDAAVLIERNDSFFKYHLDRYKYPQRFGPETDAAFHRQKAGLFLAELDERLLASINLCGEQERFADIALLPFVRQFAATEPELFSSLPYPNLQAWLNRWLESERFNSAMQRHAQWHPGDAETLLF